MKKFILTLSLSALLLVALPLCIGASAPNAEAAEPDAFSMLYEAAAAHVTEIFSAIAAAGALVIALCYRKGLIPLLKNGIGAIGSATKEWGKSAENYGKEAKEICQNANDYIHILGEKAEQTQNCILSIEQKISKLGDRMEETEQIKAVLEGQMDMLYDVFLSSSLPEFEKERVSLRMEKMKQALRTSQSGGEGNA